MMTSVNGSGEIVRTDSMFASDGMIRTIGILESKKTPKPQNPKTPKPQNPCSTFNMKRLWIECSWLNWILYSDADPYRTVVYNNYLFWKFLVGKEPEMNYMYERMESLKIKNKVTDLLFAFIPLWDDFEAKPFLTK